MEREGEHEGERAIVEGLRRGDRAAFDAAYALHRARIYGFLLRLSGRRDVADDLFQEVWTKLAQHAPRLREDTVLSAWLFTVARNAHTSHRRWNMLDLSRLVALGDEAPYASEAPLPDAQVEASRAMVRLERALAALSVADREALLLVGVEGFEQDAAAAIAGVSYAAFRQRLGRARVRLSEKLARLEANEANEPGRGEVSV